MNCENELENLALNNRLRRIYSLGYSFLEKTIPDLDRNTIEVSDLENCYNILSKMEKEFEEINLKLKNFNKTIRR